MKKGFLQFTGFLLILLAAMMADGVMAAMPMVQGAVILLVPVLLAGVLVYLSDWGN